jgi:AcrR family transcriptional regulator
MSSVTSTTPATRSLRADAARNRARILEAAEEVFAEKGIAVPVDAVAESAGVGVGTLYRHFPTKEDLFEAIVVMRLDALCAAAEKHASGGGHPGDALRSFLRDFASQATAKRDLYEALQESGIDIKSRCGESFGTLERGIDKLLRRAKAAHQVRREVTVQDVMVLVSGICQAQLPDRKPASLERMLDIVFRGIQP